MKHLGNGSELLCSNKISATLSMDATKVAPSLLLSPRHGAAIGRVPPEHIIPLTGPDTLTSATASSADLAAEIKVNYAA
jgi:hypothetical protein